MLVQTLLKLVKSYSVLGDNKCVSKYLKIKLQLPGQPQRLQLPGTGSSPEHDQERI